VDALDADLTSRAAPAVRAPAFRLFSYENALVLMLGVTFGVVFMDRLAVNYLAPFIVRDLRLSSTELGLTASALSITWALTNIGAGRLSDVMGRRKPLLVAAVLVFSCCSFVSGLATSFAVLIAARLFMGLAEGPVPPLVLTLMAQSSSPRRIGLNTGLIINGFLSLFASVLGPVVLIGLAQAFSWRAAFWIAAVPGLIMAALIARFVREKRPAPQAEAQPQAQVQAQRARGPEDGFLRIVARRNILLCTLIACFVMAFLLIGSTFTTLYLVDVRHVPATQAGLLLGVQGLAMMASFVVAALSDRIGRKPAVVAASLLGLAAPIGLLWYHGPLWGLGVFLALSGLAQGVTAVLYVAIPAETVPLRQLGTASGFIPGMGELVGSVCGPLIAGWAADRTGPAAPFLIMAGCSLAATLLALGLKETLGHRPADPLDAA
jgi:MFS family permease